MKILHLIAYHVYSGPAAPSAILSQAMRRAGHRASIAADTHRGLHGYEEPMIPKLKELGLLTPLPLSLSTKAPPWKTLRDIMILRRQGDGLDVMHCHMSHDHAEAALARRGRRPILVRTVHAARSLRNRPGQGLLLSSADGLIVRSELHRQHLHHAFGIDLARIAVIPGSLDLAQWTLSDAAARGRAGRGRWRLGDGPVVGLVAMMQPGRGHEQLLTHFQEVVRAWPTARLLLVGNGELEGELRAQADRLHLASHVVFTGYLGTEDLHAAYAAMDLVVHLRPGNDIAARNVLEAMALERPVLTLAGEGFGALERAAIVETVAHEKSGFIVGPQEEARLGSLLAGHLSDRARLAAMGRAARSSLSPVHLIETEAQATLDFYRKLGAND